MSNVYFVDRDNVPHLIIKLNSNTNMIAKYIVKDTNLIYVKFKNWTQEIQ